MWLEPVAATVLFALALLMNHRSEWPLMWLVDLAACGGAAMSRRRPVLGSILTGLGMAFWLPFPGAIASASGLAFYINVFAAARSNLSWRIPLTLGFAGMAYLSLVRHAVTDPAYRGSTIIILVIVLAISYGGGTAFRFAARGLQRERETGHERLVSLQVSLARELHDSVAQTLSSAAMRANIALMDPAVEDTTREQLERIADECRSSAHDLRQLLSALRDQPDRDVAPGPLADVETLRQTVDGQAERLRAEGFTVDVDVQLTKLSAARCQTLAAVTIEAANNVLKHAVPNSSCTFSIVADDEAVVGDFTNVQKNTRGVQQGFGLTGIQERLTLLDGTCSVLRRRGTWTLQVRLPIGTDGKQLAAPAPQTTFAGVGDGDTGSYRL